MSIHLSTGKIKCIVLTEKGESADGALGFFQHEVGAKNWRGEITEIQYNSGWFVIFVNNEPAELINSRLVMSVVLSQGGE